MKKHLNLVTLLLMIIIGLPVSAQVFTDIPRSKKTISETFPGLQIGDSVPEIYVKKLINNKEKIGFRISDFKDRLLIIDFWSVTCSGCVKALPRMDSLQKTFGNKIKILPVTYEKKDYVQEFWDKNIYTKNLNLPSVVEDTLFSKYFRHLGIPHEVWIYKGKVIAITSSEYVDVNNVQKVLSGEKITWPVKNDFLSFDLKQPLFTLDSNQLKTQFTSHEYAAICGFRSGINSGGLSGGWGIERDSIKKTVRVYMFNQPIYTTFEILSNAIFAFSGKLITPTGGTGIMENQIIWKVADRSRFQYRGKGRSGYEEEWVLKNSICFESFHKDTGQTDRDAYELAFRELNNLLGLNVHWERMNKPVYKLTRDTSVINKVAVTNGVSANNLLGKLMEAENSPYIFNEVGTVKLPAFTLETKNLSKLDDLLKPYGLRFLVEDRQVDYLIFFENKNLFPDQKLIDEYNIKKSQNGKTTNANNNKIFLDRNRQSTNIVMLKSGVQYTVNKKGDGKIPMSNSLVKVHYTGMLINGDIFDSTLSTGLPNVFLVSELVPGLSDALQHMPVGSKWTIYVPAKLGYGEKTINGIPANSDLVFEVDLLNIIN